MVGHETVDSLIPAPKELQQRIVNISPSFPRALSISSFNLKKTRWTEWVVYLRPKTGRFMIGHAKRTKAEKLVGRGMILSCI
jgi:hypothetical protein